MFVALDVIGNAPCVRIFYSFFEEPRFYTASTRWGSWEGLLVGMIGGVEWMVQSADYMDQELELEFPLGLLVGKRCAVEGVSLAPIHETIVSAECSRFHTSKVKSISALSITAITPSKGLTSRSESVSR